MLNVLIEPWRVAIRSRPRPALSRAENVATAVRRLRRVDSEGAQLLIDLRRFSMRVLLVSVGIKRLFVVSDALDPWTRIISVGGKYLEGHLGILLFGFCLGSLTSPGWLLQVFYFR